MRGIRWSLAYWIEERKRWWRVWNMRPWFDRGEFWWPRYPEDHIRAEQDYRRLTGLFYDEHLVRVSCAEVGMTYYELMEPFVEAVGPKLS